MSNQNNDDFDDDFDMDFVLTPLQAKRNRIKWEKDILKAKKIIYTINNDIKELKLIYVYSVDFEF